MNLTLVILALSIELPPEDATLKQAPGIEAAQPYCATCHSADYISTQPPGLSKDFWNAEVVKMKKMYGAPIPDEQIAPITEYLFKSYGAGAK